MLSPGDAKVGSPGRTGTMKRTKALLGGLMVAGLIALAAGQPAQAEDAAFVAVERPECTAGEDLDTMGCWLVWVD